MASEENKGEIGSGMAWHPQDYQVEGIKLLLSQGAVALFLDPGWPWKNQPMSSRYQDTEGA